MKGGSFQRKSGAEASDERRNDGKQKGVVGVKRKHKIRIGYVKFHTYLRRKHYQLIKRSIVTSLKYNSLENTKNSFA